MGTANSRRRVNLQPRAAPAAAAFVYGYSIYRVLEEATHRDGESVGLDNLKIALDDPFFRYRSRKQPAAAADASRCDCASDRDPAVRKGRAVAGLAIFIPYMLPVAVVGVLFGQLLTLHGALNTSLTIGLGRFAQLGSPDWALRSLAGVIIWRELGFGVILFLAVCCRFPKTCSTRPGCAPGGFGCTAASLCR